MKHFQIKHLPEDLRATLQYKIDQKTKPVGALGVLERIALQIGMIQKTENPVLTNPAIVIFASDHGIAREGVSAYPPEVTWQMVYNFLSGGAAINVFARQHGISVKIVDAGVNHDFEPHPGLIDAKIGYGTKSYMHGAAMTLQECEQAIEKGAEIVADLHRSGCNVVGFGEMGIGNSSSAAILMSIYCNLTLDECVGAGTGHDSEGMEHKKRILTMALMNHHFDYEDTVEVLMHFGGYEIAMMCGAMLQAAELRMVILVDGFIATTPLLAASRICPWVLQYCIFTHRSHEKGHERMLKFLRAEPLLQLNMRLGEGSGVAVAYPIVQSAVNFLNEMASFESAQVSGKQ